jgi:hypothetical protein
MKEKADIAVAVASCLPSGDYFEFGSVGLKTFQNMLTAADVWNLQGLGRDTHFYAFDIFGKLDPATEVAKANSGVAESYFADFTTAGDARERHENMLTEHGVFLDRCHFIQGLYEDTLTDDWKDAYLATGGGWIRVPGLQHHLVLQMRLRLAHGCGL